MKAKKKATKKVAKKASKKVVKKKVKKEDKVVKLTLTYFAYEQIAIALISKRDSKATPKHEKEYLQFLIDHVISQGES